jgi:para-aminobenzoate synthetase component 1
MNADNHHVVSTSPERFVRQAGKQVETRPIKGTRPRGRSPDEDQAMRQALCDSAKDEAELSMIVDLLRNDLGRVCRAGSIRVTDHKRVEAYVNVFHLVSIINGELRDGMGPVDLIKAVFPGGSITGCPRIRAMEIIDELEPCQRHIYTGSIGYISFHDTLDLSIAIRTATIIGDNLLFSVGGGIVYDSDAEDEYQETLAKGRAIMNTLAGESKGAPSESYIWQNGRLESLATAGIPVSDLGLQYGFGFFETIRVEKGMPEFLAEHVRRFNHSWQHLFQTPLPDVTWADIISQVIEKNGLSETTAAVKLMATRGSRSQPPYDHQLMVTARPYVPRPSIAENGGLALATYPFPRQTPLADFKSMNYLYYYLAGKWAAENAADEALILNPDGSVSETNTANVLMLKGHTVYVPVSPHVLNGVMQAQVIAGLANMGYEITDQRLSPADLLSADTVILTNSLIGAVPAVALDGRPMPVDSDLCQKIRLQVLWADTES